ncbi:SDR family oxidoreductase [Kocuria sp. cx-116]|uniref:SDR family NAD(P)-dependent oxidoreductase n=1 Tax=Kocuria sp. cx-116 TaxID=2771378 RepID=UPI001684D1B1|nr:SDR family oxidoreductase [Kocuria sp. cx-116]MBD2762472.1 SDR family oxidoreductase [Kocuria sp. cx-116]
MELKNKVVVVTGGGAGIGRATVLALLARGATVAAVDLNESGLVETQAVAGGTSRLSSHVVNIADREAVCALPEKITEVHGHVDGLVNIAGIIQPFVHVSELDFELMERVVDVNFWGTVNMTKAFLPVLLRRPAASLVNVSSMGAILPVPGQTAYGASKAAVSLFTEGLFTELQDTAVSVTEVFPGGIATDIMKNSGVERANENKGNTAPNTTTAPEAARQIVDAMEKERFRVHIGRDAKLFDKLSRLIPERAIRLIAQKMKDVG